MKTDELLQRLQRHYIKPGEALPGGVFVPEVGRNGHGSGRCDAIYIGFTSTSGRIMVGHELKVSRADWRHELDQPGKADTWADDCHAWYVVAPSVEIVRPEELPVDWGLMIPSTRSKTRMEIAVKPAFDPDRQPSWHTVRSVFARLDTLRANAIADARVKAHRDADRELDKRVDERLRTRVDNTSRRAEELLARFQEAVGPELQIAAYGNRDAVITPEELGAALVVWVRAHRDWQRASQLLLNRYSGLGQLATNTNAAQRALDDLRILAEIGDE